MALVSPVKLITALVVLIGGGVDAQGAVWITFGQVILGKVVLDVKNDNPRACLKIGDVSSSEGF